ncbi:hypothetical protein DY000_02049302 [Brassica cretica]|uniref:Chromo domain-containing protein n=1 Tax=Brassica cretica TaxID=69181 RepID=A0ABQ7ENF8_BRACR|nr:hypothetical protein DY000_02049302 [Brassica cretica]
MEGSPCWKFSIFWKGARFQGPNSGFLLAGTWSVPLSGTRGSGSCLEPGGNDTEAGPRSIGLASLGSTQAGTHFEPREIVRGSSSMFVWRFVFTRGLSPDTCKVFLGFSILPLQFLLPIPLVSFFLPLEDFLRSSYLDLVFILQVTSPSLSPTFRSFLRSAPEMRTESGLSPDSSFVESFTGRGSRYPPIGPPSVIGAEEVAIWRKKYELPDDVAIRVPDPEDRVSDFGVDEVPVYEGYFPSGFRDQIPSLVAKISETLGISPVPVFLLCLSSKWRRVEISPSLAATENVSLRSQLKNREELNDLKDAAETFEAEKAMALNGAKVVARWELMLEWLSGHTDSWDPVYTLEQYKTVKITKAELLGLPAPSFEYEPQVPGDEEVKKTPEPAADDPPAN